MHSSIRTAAVVVASSLVLSLGLLASPRELRAADEDAAPSVVVVLNAADELLADAEYLLKLTDTTEQKQWKVLKDYLEVFLIGVDRKLPGRIQVIFNTKQNRTVSSFPVDDLPKFLKQNLKPLGIDSKLLGDGLYQLGRGRKQDAYNGFLQSSPPYTHIGETRDDLKLVPPNPLEALKAIVAKGFAGAVEAQNAKTDAESQAARRRLFQTTRKQTLAAMKKEKGETPEDFELRKKATEIEMDEVEWFFAESEHFLTGVTIDRAKGEGRANLELTPIANSSLAKAVSELGTKPSYFANIEKNPNAILTGRINHPLNDVRQKSAGSMAALITDRLKTQADADAKLSADEKTAAKQLADKVNELLQAGIKAGIADGFVDAYPATSGKNVMVGGFRTPDGSKLPEILALVPKASSGDTVKNDVGEESGVKIQAIEFAKEKHPQWHDFFGSGSLYVGSSKDAVWYAGGEGSLDVLKAAIKKTSQPAAAGKAQGSWVEFAVKLKPFMNEAATLPVKRKGEEAYRKMAISSLQQGEDQISGHMDLKEGKIQGELLTQKGLLRFAGKVISDFSRENLDDTPKKNAKNGN